MPTYSNPYTSTGYPLGAAPQAGLGAHGGVPGAIQAPNPFRDLSSIYPNLSGTNTAASSALLSGLQGQLSAGTQNLIKDAAAAWGVASGMPGSGLAGNKSLRDLGLTSEAVQQKALAQLPGIMDEIARTQTVSPELQAEIANRNATLAAAPNPAAAANYAQQLFQKYLNQTRQGPGGIQIGGLGGGNRDLLGFNTDTSTLTGGGGPSEFVYGATGTPGQIGLGDPLNPYSQFPGSTVPSDLTFPTGGTPEDYFPIGGDVG